jgi:DNA-directed RNA polymerase subunit M/transcription elongation factor TFIIS
MKNLEDSIVDKDHGIENCPQCGKKLHPPLKSSGRQVCASCGWSNVKRNTESTSDFKSDKLSYAKETSPKLQKFGEYSSAILVAILIGLIVSQVSKPRYEYKVISPSDLSFEESMDRYGSEGWKAVSCRRAQDSVTDSMSYECIMLRETRLPR